VTGKSNQQATPPWVMLLMIATFAFIFWQFIPQKDRPRLPLEPTTQSWAFPLVGGLAAAGVAFAIQFFRLYDPAVRRANKRALAGDLEGAIADLREQIEAKGPTGARASALGLLLIQSERWAEAVPLFQKAEELGAVKGVCQANRGFALLKGGKPAEALPVLRQALDHGPHVPVMKCLVCLHTCLALAELGRWDEAREQLRVAEFAVAEVNKSHAAALAREFEQCRQKLEEEPRKKSTSDGLAEL
jgi:tetratricopeptide (TPR) repeat protein